MKFDRLLLHNWSGDEWSSEVAVTKKIQMDMNVHLWSRCIHTRRFVCCFYEFILSFVSVRVANTCLHLHFTSAVLTSLQQMTPMHQTKPFLAERGKNTLYCDCPSSYYPQECSEDSLNIEHHVIVTIKKRQHVCFIFPRFRVWIPSAEVANSPRACFHIPKTSMEDFKLANGINGCWSNAKW